MLGRAIEDLLTARQIEGVSVPGAAGDRPSTGPAGVASRLDSIEKRLARVEKSAEIPDSGT